MYSKIYDDFEVKWKDGSFEGLIKNQVAALGLYEMFIKHGMILFNEPKKQIETICEIFKECSFEIKKIKDQKLESEKEFCLVNKDLIDSRFKAKDIAMLSKMFVDLVEDQYGDVFILAVKKFIEQD